MLAVCNPLIGDKQPAMDATDIKITALRARPVDVPMARPLHTSGGTVDGDALVRDFLGREPNTEAFMRDLGLTE